MVTTIKRPLRWHRSSLEYQLNNQSTVMVGLSQ